MYFFFYKNLLNNNFSFVNNFLHYFRRHFTFFFSFFDPVLTQEEKVNKVVFSLLEKIEQYKTDEIKRFNSTFLKDNFENDIKPLECDISTPILSTPPNKVARVFENNGGSRRDGGIISWNSNLDPIFYQMKNYDQMIIQECNEFENMWKKRILMEHTPIGNVIMYYNVYKKGFSYYSDVHITYPLLNIIAMKYVRIFFCRDLFIDDLLTPIDNPSPLIALEKEYEKETEKKEKEKKKGINNEKKPLIKNGPFLKNKSGIQKVIGGGDNTKKQIQQYFYNVNKFIYMGKVRNFSFTQKIEKRIIHPPIFKNTFNDLFDNEHNVQKEVFSYRDYKNMVPSASAVLKK